MTVKLDIPALADAIDPRINPMICGDAATRDSVQHVRDLIAASDALRSLTTALEIGRAMGRADVIAVIEERRAAWAATEADLRNDTPDVARISGAKARAARELLEIIRSTPSAVDLEGLTERIAKLIADEDGNLALFDQGRNLLPGHGQGECDSCDGKRDNYRRVATAVLSSLGLHAREN